MREDAVLHNGRYMVPTEPHTQWIETWEAFRRLGVLTFSEDQTEVTLTLPEGYKFGIRFMERYKTTGTS